MKLLLKLLKNNFIFRAIKNKLKNFIIVIVKKENSILQIISQEHIEGRLKYTFYSSILHVNKDIKGELIPIDFPFGPGSNIIVPENCKLTLGQNTIIGRNVEIGPYKEINIGDQTSIQDRCILLGNIKIGRYCTFSYNIYLSSGRHIFDYKPYLNIKDQDKLVSENADMYSELDRPIVIEDDVWIGYNVMIMSGVTIGKGAIIGSNSVVTKSVQPYSVVVGSPAKVIKTRLDFNPPNEIRWDREEDFPYFYSGFLVSLKEREEYKELKGIVALNKFSVCLSKKNATQIQLVVKKNHNLNVHIEFNNETKEVTNEFSELKFSISNESSVYSFKVIANYEFSQSNIVIEKILLF
ncbi:MAG: CatB-related O-acetyltransferase [Leptospiraceae bacterium]|nr:CatB-related O-acetyltransferase [Leptospiraceae bacterium]